VQRTAQHQIERQRDLVEGDGFDSEERSDELSILRSKIREDIPDTIERSEMVDLTVQQSNLRFGALPANF